MGEISKKYQHNKDEVIYEDGTRQQQYQANPHPIGTALTQSEECGQGRTPKPRRRRRLETIADTSQSHKILPTKHHDVCERLSLTHIILMSRLLSLSTGCRVVLWRGDAGRGAVERPKNQTKDIGFSLLLYCISVLDRSRLSLSFERPPAAAKHTSYMQPRHTYPMVLS